MVRETAKPKTKAAPPALVAGALLAAAFFAGATAGCSLRGGDKPGDAAVLTAPVRTTDFQLEVHATGELRSTHTVNLVAPPIGGGSLQIIRLPTTGDRVSAGHVVVAFDPSEQEYNLTQSRSDLAEAKEEILKARDDAAVQTAGDRTNLLKAKFAVRQAQLQVSKNELLSAIDAKKNILALDQAKRALAQLQADIKSHAASNQATLALSRQKLDKARLSITEAQRNIANMQVRSPIDGLVIVRENRMAFGGIIFSGMSLPQFQVGDQVGSGTLVAQVIDVSHMELAGQIKQADRTNVSEGDAVEIQVNSIPGVTFSGKLTRIAGMAAGGFFSPAAGAKVAVTVRFDHPDPRLRPGFSAHILILGRRLKNVLIVPREAVFNLTGTPVVYVKHGSGFERHAVKIRYLTDAAAVIGGLAQGTEVALVNPEQTTSSASSKPPAHAPVPGPGGR